MARVMHCHFSYRRPKGKNYGLFACALYLNEGGKEAFKPTAVKVRKYPLWMNQQHVTAIQSYQHALECIWDWQYQLIKHNVTDVMLVTNNSTLEGWIIDPYKNKAYTSYMKKAVSPYRTGASKELLINVGVLRARESERSKKYCREDMVCNNSSYNKQNRISIDGGKSILDIVNDSKIEGLDSMVPVN